MQRILVLVGLGIFSFSASSLSNIDPLHQRGNGSRPVPVSPVAYAEPDEVSEFDPSAPGAMETLKAFDAAYRAQTGEETYSDFSPFAGLVQQAGGCIRASCRVFANVVKNQRPQMLYLYVDGNLVAQWKVSTAKAGHVTPDFEGHPAGPFYAGAYTSRKYPEGDYQGLGNMPFAIFYSGGFAIHGTPSIGRLGIPASHGCVRSHPDNANYFSQLVRSVGARQVWVTVSQGRVNPSGSDLTMSESQ